ncbi:inverse autotransporter beta domain-containing protein [Thorsellia anophelis]|uniref:Ig-like domain (Group 1) n=1 Tax=Thorsellia anophelis DSM 18579 TaxID=1123402 RepID=A0A1I0FCD1_9GAMM|nr:inverse autotransporter beta domain-containing protein [Thorsellia anophelis]SET55913.1 Ig-like domain (group 1) [Thorsellia anophelis DSM 18579]
MKKTLKFKKSFVYMTLISYITSPLMMTFSPVVMALQTSPNSGSSNAEQLITNELVNKSARGFENWLGQFGKSKIQLNLDEDFNFSDSSFDTLLAIQDTEPVLTFTQFGARYKNDRVTLNMGLGQRHFIDENMLGYNAFYDYEVDNAHSRIGLGLEYAANFFKATSNGYIGLSGYEASEKTADISEKVADGIDLRLEGYLPQFPQMGASATYEQYFGQDVTLFSEEHKQNDPRAVAIGLNYTPVPLVTIGAEHKMGEHGLDESSINLSFNIALGKSFEAQIDPDEVKNQRSLIGSRYDLVNRNNLIVLERKTNKFLISLPSMISGKGGQIVPLDMSSSDGIVRYEWDADDFFAAGGKITKVDGVWEFTLPDYLEGQNNQYTVGLVVIDNQGKRSEPTSTIVTVNKKEELNLGSKDGSLEVTVAEPTVNGVQTLVKIPIVDENGHAVANQAVELTITEPDGKISTITVLTDEKGVASHSFMQTKAGETLIEARFGGREFSKTVVYQPVATNITPSFKDSTVNITSGNNFISSDSVEAVASIPVVDDKGNPLAGIEVEFTVTDASGESNVITATTDANGIASLPISQQQVGNVNVSAKVGNSTATGSATIKPIVPAVKDGQINVTSENGFIVTDAEINKVIVPIVDQNGNVLSNVDVTINVTGPDGLVIEKIVKTDEFGNAILPFAQIKAGETVITATVNGSAITKNVTFIADKASAVIDENGLVVTKNGAVADLIDVNTVQVTIKDKFGNLVSDMPIEFSSVQELNLGGKATSNIIMTNTDGVAITNLTTTKAQIFTVNASVNGLTATKDVNFIVGAPDASKSLLTAVPSTIKTLPSSVTTLTLALKDKYENPINGKTVAFNTIVPAGDFSMGSVTAKQDGTYVVQYSVNRTRTSDFANIVTPISVTVNGQAFSIAPQNITVQREYYEVPVGEIVDNQALTESQVTALLDKYESVRLFMTNGRYATTITLPASAKKGAALEVTSNTDLTTVLSGSGISPVFIDKKQVTLIRFIHDGIKWNEITRS